MLEETESIMRRNEAIQILQGEAQSLLDYYSISALFLFGSVARDEAQEDSDVDILVEFNDPIGLFQLIALKRDLETLLGCRVDIGTRRSLKPQVKGRVLQEAIRIF